MTPIRHLLLLVFLAAAAGVRAQAADAAQASRGPRFEIRNFVVEGASLLTNEEIARTIKPFTGQNKDVSDVQRALEALERAYSDKGYNAVQIILPEQELEKGEVRFKIVEAKIGKLVIEGSKFFDEANIRRSLPSVQSGQAPNIHGIASNLRVANENPAKQTSVLLRGGSEEGLVDAVVRVTDERPSKYSLAFDNTGTKQTGIFRVGFGYQQANLWNLDHVLSMQYVTSPNAAGRTHRVGLTPSREVFIFGGSYRIPLYRLGDSLDFSVGYSNVNSGVVHNLFNVSGSGSIFGVRYNLNLPRRGELEQRLALGWDWRGYSNKVAIAGGGTPPVPDVTVHPVSVTYLGLYRGTASETSFNAGIYKNLAGGSDGGTQAFEAARTGAEANFSVTRYGMNHMRAFGNDWQARFAFSGQMTRDRLVSGEQFGMGGADSVRGFVEREDVNDNGYRGSAEVYTPDCAARISWLPGGSHLRTLLFYDWGQLRRYRPLPGELQRSGVGSAGFGVRYSRGTGTSLRFDYAVVTDAGGLQGRGDARVHASLLYIF